MSVVNAVKRDYESIEQVVRLGILIAENRTRGAAVDGMATRDRDGVELHRRPGEDLEDTIRVRVHA